MAKLRRHSTSRRVKTRRGYREVPKMEVAITVLLFLLLGFKAALFIGGYNF